MVALLRAIGPEASGEIELLLNTEAAQSWIREGRLVASEVIPTGDAAADSVRHPGGIVVEHPRIEVWTYPAEWSFSMLRDAALLQLDLTASALEFDMITKDATPYNVQFLAGRPQFIDLGSFERYREGEPWVAYRQFCPIVPLPADVAGIRRYPAVGHVSRLDRWGTAGIRRRRAARPSPPAQGRPVTRCAAGPGRTTPR
jgi:hypothetical protein